MRYLIFCRYPYGREYKCKENDIDFSSIPGSSNTSSPGSSSTSADLLTITDVNREKMIRCIDISETSCPYNIGRCSAKQRGNCCVCGGGRVFDTSRGSPVNDMNRDGRPDSLFTKGSSHELCCDYNPFNILNMIFENYTSGCPKTDVNGNCAKFHSDRTNVCHNPFYNEYVEDESNVWDIDQCTTQKTTVVNLAKGCMDPSMDNYDIYATVSTPKTCNPRSGTPVQNNHDCINIRYDIPNLENCTYSLLNDTYCEYPTCEEGFKSNGDKLRCLDGTVSGFSCTPECSVVGTYYKHSTCKNVSNCLDTQHESKEPTAVSDRECTQNNCTCTHGVTDHTCVPGNEKCVSCDDGFHVVNHLCIKNECTCTNATQVPSTNCSYDKENKCKNCDWDQHAEDGICKNNQCFCPHGTPGSCTEDNAHICTRCEYGYYLNTTSNHCVPYVQCSCSYGTPFNFCKSHSERCTACDSGYSLNIYYRCVESQQCLCSNGNAMFDCVGANKTRCDSCNGRFYLENENCLSLSLCTNDQYEQYPMVNYTRNRICKNFSTVTSNNYYQISPGGLYMDNDIRRKTECNTGKYEFEPGTNTSDRQCRQNQCTCSHGTGTVGVNCPANDINYCGLCISGYSLTGDFQIKNRCVRDSTVFNTCDSEQFQCGDNLTSQYNEAIVGNDIVVTTNGIPNHIYHTNVSETNENKVCAIDRRLRIPRHPKKQSGGFRPYPKDDPIGILKTGSLLYNYDTKVRRNADSQTLDLCKGSARNDCQYNNREISTQTDCGFRECEHIGYMRDGFKIYSQCQKNGQFLEICRSGNNCLDKAGGYDFTDSNIKDVGGNKITGYGYVALNTYPYLPTMYIGIELYDITRQCKDNQYDSETGCQYYTNINNTQYIVNQTPYADRTIKTLTPTCPNGFYEQSAPTNTTDRICARNKCICYGEGIASAGIRCPKNGTPHCLTCNTGHKMNDHNGCETEASCTIETVNGTCTSILQTGETCTMACAHGQIGGETTCFDGTLQTQPCRAISQQDCTRIKQKYNEDNCQWNPTTECSDLKQYYVQSCQC